MRRCYRYARFLLLPLLLIAGTGQSAEPAAPWWTVPAAADDSANWLRVLGTSPALWRFTARGPVLWGPSPAGPVPRGGPSGVTLDTGAGLAPESEIYLEYRLAVDENPKASLTLSLGAGTLEEEKARVLRVAITPGEGAISWNLIGYESYESRIYNRLTLQPVTALSLAWPEDLRQRIEAEMATQQPLAQRRLSLRLQLSQGQMRLYLNECLVTIQPLVAGRGQGPLRLVLAHGAELQQVRIRPLPKADTRFVTVPLGALANARVLVGEQGLDPASLPPPETLVQVGGVPFVLAKPNGAHDHVDLAPSYSRFGNLPGRHAGNAGPVGARWGGGSVNDPGRLWVNVPSAPYIRAHLLAVADGAPDEWPGVTLQFFKPNSGFPESFSALIPHWQAPEAPGAKALDLRLTDGRPAKLFQVTVPLSASQLSHFSDLDILGLELTKQVHIYRAMPDPLYYSKHAGGLPSGVHVWALTLERAAAEMAAPVPDAPAHVFTAPAKVSYTVPVKNLEGPARTVSLVARTRSFDGIETSERTVPVKLLPGKVTTAKVALTPKRFGLHTLELELVDGEQRSQWVRDFAHLAPDTRQRGNWQHDQGGFFGFWAWNGSHGTPKADIEIPVMAAAGAETSTMHYGTPELDPAVKALAEKHQMLSLGHSGHGHIYDTAFGNRAMAEQWNPADPEATGKALIEALRKRECPPSAVSRPEYISFFPEPGVGISTYSNLPEYYGQPPYELTPPEQARYEAYLAKFLIGARAVRQTWPHLKILLPYGDPLFAVPFLRKSPEARELIDGVGVDQPNFERMPESQLHQVVLHRIWQSQQEFAKAGKPHPRMIVVEGPCVGAAEGSLSPQEQADYLSRIMLHYLAYGIYEIESLTSAFDCSSYWGEQHYGFGLLRREPIRSPKPAYTSYATLTRHLNRCLYEATLETGSRTVFGLRFKHHASDKRVHVLWTVRGTRPVTLTVPATIKRLEWYDQMDNLTVLTPKNGQVTLTVGTSPGYLEGLGTEATFTLGEPDHGDQLPGQLSVKLSNLATGWRFTGERDALYENNHPMQIVRFPSPMTATPAPAPAAQGGQALAITLPPPAKDPKLMPLYDILRPAQPLPLAGRGSHLGLWAQGASDWGRVVFVLRDAKGERWTSIGTREQWNCDDIMLKSYFNYDGWRYLRFELPGQAPYDRYRLAGTVWWGSAGGDGQVDLPLALEALIIERRTHLMFVNGPATANQAPVLLGDLLVEYADPADQTAEAIRLDALRPPPPATAPTLSNPIAELTAAGAGQALAVTAIADPDHEYDGTRCLVQFAPLAGAQTYEIWVSAYADGRGALQLGKDWKAPGGLIRGLRPETDFYAFVIARQADGSHTPPGAGYKFRLKDYFAMK